MAILDYKFDIRLVAPQPHRKGWRKILLSLLHLRLWRWMSLLMRLLSIAIQDSYFPNEVAYMDDPESLNIMTSTAKGLDETRSFFCTSPPGQSQLSI